MYVDMHSHLRGWSPDAKQSIEELLEAAAKVSLGGIAITDHYEIESVTSDGVRWIFDPKQYCEQNACFRKKPSEHTWKDRPGVLVGIEIGYLANHVEEIRQLISRNTFDCVILSLHVYQGIDPVTDPRDLYSGELSAVYEKIVRAIGDTSETFPEINIIGHYDFFSRYVPGAEPKMLYRHAPEAFDRLFQLMIRNQQALEINTGTVEALHKKYGYPLGEAMPDPNILLRYRELGGTLITLGSDAHCAKDVARYFHETAAWLLEQGILSLAWMEEQRWHSAPLS